MCFKKRYRKGIFIVTYKIEKNKIKYLILKRKLHWKGYEFPKGGIEKFEFPSRTVRRELFEETGLVPKKIKNHHVKGFWNYKKEMNDRPGLVGQTWKLFSVLVEGDKIKIDKKEHSGFEWLSYKNALKKLTYENQKKCLEIVNNRNEKKFKDLKN